MKHISTLSSEINPMLDKMSADQFYLERFGVKSEMSSPALLFVVFFKVDPNKFEE
jgi:hypothetical protein